MHHLVTYRWKVLSDEYDDSANNIIDLDAERIARLCIQHKRESLVRLIKLSGVNPDAELIPKTKPIIIRVNVPENRHVYEKLTKSDLRRFWKKSGLTMQRVAKLVGIEYDNMRQLCTRSPMRKTLKPYMQRALQVAIMNPKIWRALKKRPGYYKKLYAKIVEEQRARREQRRQRRAEQIANGGGVAEGGDCRPEIDVERFEERNLQTLDEDSTSLN